MSILLGESERRWRAPALICNLFFTRDVILLVELGNEWLIVSRWVERERRFLSRINNLNAKLQESGEEKTEKQKRNSLPFLFVVEGIFYAALLSIEPFNALLRFVCINCPCVRSCVGNFFVTKLHCHHPSTSVMKVKPRSFCPQRHHFSFFFFLPSFFSWLYI